MTIRTLGGRPEDHDHLRYDDATGRFERRDGLAPLDDLCGGFVELADGDIWGIFRGDDDARVFFREDQMYPDDPKRFLVWVDILGERQARLNFVLDGKVVEKVVYPRVGGVGTHWSAAREEDVDMFLGISRQHDPRRALWPELFAKDST